MDDEAEVTIASTPVEALLDDEAAPPMPRLRVQFAAPASAATPIHALRTGTFTDSAGREATFTPADLRQMAERLNETTQRRRPPINQNHDYGAAVGRMVKAYTRHGDNHLYIEPKWNTEGQRLLAEEYYDAFSIELETAKGYSIIGGALTNYPAVNGLKPVTLSAPETGVAVLVLPPADEPAQPLLFEENPTMDETQAATQPADVAAPPAPTMPAPPTLNLSDPAVKAQFEAYTTEMQAAYRQQYALAMEAAKQEARAQFERYRADEQRRTALLTFAQHVTTPTMARPTSIAYTVDQVMDLLTAPTAEKVQQLFKDALDGALMVSAATSGSSREAAEEGGQFDALVLSYQQQGMSGVDAIKAAARKRPDLYAAQSQPKGGR